MENVDDRKERLQVETFVLLLQLLLESDFH